MKQKMRACLLPMLLLLMGLAGNFKADAQTQDVPQVIIIPDPAEQSLIRFQRTAPPVVVLGPTVVITPNNVAVTNPLAGVLTNAGRPLTNGLVAATNSFLPPPTNAVATLTNALVPPATNLLPPATNMVVPLGPGLFGPPAPTGAPLLNRGRQPVIAPSFLPPLVAPTSTVPVVPPLQSPGPGSSPTTPILPPTGRP